MSEDKLLLLLTNLDWRLALIVIVGVIVEKEVEVELILRHKFTSAAYFSTKVLTIFSKFLLHAIQSKVSPFLIISLTFNVA